MKFMIYGLSLFFSTTSVAESANQIPLLKQMSSCELDINKDGNPDIAILVETVSGREAIVLVRNENGYNSFLVRGNSQNMLLSCYSGNSIQETQAGKGKGKVYKTMGTYIKLVQPEGASVAYFWNGSGFTEVWTSD